MNLGKALSFGGCLGFLSPESVVAITNDPSDEMHSKVWCSIVVPPHSPLVSFWYMYYGRHSVERENEHGIA